MEAAGLSVVPSKPSHPRQGSVGQFHALRLRGVASANRQQGQSRTPPPPLSAPGSALGLLPSSALSSAQAVSSLREALPKRQIARGQVVYFKFLCLGALPPNPQDLSLCCQDGSQETRWR